MTMQHEWQYGKYTYTAKTVQEARHALGELAMRLLRQEGFPSTVTSPSGRRRRIRIEVNFEQPQGD